MFSVTPSLATNASTAFNPYLGPVSPGLVPAEILQTGPMLVAGNPGMPVPAAAAAAAQKLMRTDRLEVRNSTFIIVTRIFLATQICITNHVDIC